MSSLRSLSGGRSYRHDIEPMVKIVAKSATLDRARLDHDWSPRLL